MPERVVPFSELSDQQRESLTRVNWVERNQEGIENPYWTEINDTRYGTFRHVAIVNEESVVLFDKVDLEWKPAAFVAIYRQNGDRTEFLLPSEKRILLKDENGLQGNVYIRNIPQGLIKEWENETAEQAALREVLEETGVTPKNIQKMHDIYFDAANSRSSMPFFLAEVDPDEIQTYQQSLDPGEEIRVSEDDWFALEDIPELRLQCAKTLSGLMLATGYLGIWPQNKNK